MKNKIIILAKRLILGLRLGIIWELLGDFKFFIERKTLQFKARLMRGDNQFKKELIIFSKKEKIYQPLMPENFHDIASLRGGEDRFQIIKSNLSARGGTLLDIGANFGYFCQKFEEEGFDCYAVEENKMFCYFMEKLKKMANKNFKIIPESIFDYKKSRELVFDVVLALSVFHNFLERKDMYLNLIKLLGRLRAKELFFETYLPSHLKKTKYYKDYSPEEFVNFIIKNSYFKKAELIGKSQEQRPIYKLTALPCLPAVVPRSGTKVGAASKG